MSDAPTPLPKFRGEWTELLFMTRASQQGLRVIKPWGESSRYDFVVESGGRFLRIQVKSTSYKRRHHYICTLGSGLRRYTSDEIDFFAIYVVPADAWYIMPIEIASKSRYVVGLSPHNSLSKHAQYREAWHLLR
jgi:hypothetical protein